MLIARLKHPAAAVLATLALVFALVSAAPDAAARLTRGFVGGTAFAGVTPFTLISVEGNFGFGHWNGSNNFVTTGNAPFDRQGFNSYQGATPQTMTATMLAQFASTGAVMRLVIDPGPLNMAIQAGGSLFTTEMGQIQAALALNKTAGVRTVLDLSVRPSTSVQATGFCLADTEIVAAAPSGTCFTEYKATVAAVAAYVYANDSANWVALEIFNEPPSGTGVDWASVAAPPLYTVARAGCPTCTLIVSGDSLASAAGLALLSPANFGSNDPNVIWNFHSYDPFNFVDQSQTGAPAGMDHVSGLEWPPGSSANQTTNVANATTSINGDGSLSAGQKSAMVTAMTATIGAYYSTPRGAAYTAAIWNGALTWAASNSIPNYRILMGENSAAGASTYNYLSLAGAPEDSAINYISFGTSWAKANGVSRGYFDLEDSPSGGNSFSLIPYLGAWNNRRLQALGLRLQ